MSSKEYHRIQGDHSHENDVMEETDLNDMQGLEEDANRVTTLPFRTSHLTQRKGSTSNFSLLDTEEDPSEALPMDEDDDDDDDHEPSRWTGEVSPLRRSFDSLDAQEAPGMPSASPQAVYPPAVSNLYSLSFGWDDDEEEDAADIRRYAIDTTPSPLHASLHGTSATETPTKWQQVWFSIQSIRQQARQRRAQLLLQQSDQSTLQQSIILALVTYCDATDRGILLAVLLFALWTIILTQLSPAGRPPILWGGIVLILLRVGTRPTWEFLSRRRRRQPPTSHQPLPTTSPSAKERSVMQDQDLAPNGGRLELPALAVPNSKSTRNPTDSQSPPSSDPTIHTI